MAKILGTPVYMGNGAWFVPPDPVKEREEWVRQLTARRPLADGEIVMEAEVGRWNGITIIDSDSLNAMQRAQADALNGGLGVVESWAATATSEGDNVRVRIDYVSPDRLRPQDDL
jgi:hypothetical protein